MARIAGRTDPIEKRTVRLFKGDFSRLGELFPGVGAGRAIRALVRQTIQRAEAATAPLDIDLSGIDLGDEE